MTAPNENMVEFCKGLTTLMEKHNVRILADSEGIEPTRYAPATSSVGIHLIDDTHFPNEMISLVKTQELKESYSVVSHDIAKILPIISVSNLKCCYSPNR